MKKSDVKAWSGFNMGRPLFKARYGDIDLRHMMEYDRFLARNYQSLLKGKKKMVEYGCGDGSWMHYLAINNPSREFVGVEWNDTLYEYCMEIQKPGVENLEFVQADMSEPEGILECDVCSSLGGIEHFSESVTVLKGWVDKLTPDGLCFLTVPNLLNRNWIDKRHKIPPEDYLGKDRVITDSYGYAEMWTPNHFINVAIEAGLEIIESGVISCLRFEKPLYLKGRKRADKL